MKISKWSPKQSPTNLGCSCVRVNCLWCSKNNFFLLPFLKPLQISLNLMYTPALIQESSKRSILEWLSLYSFFFSHIIVLFILLSKLSLTNTQIYFITSGLNLSTVYFATKLRPSFYLWSYTSSPTHQAPCLKRKN